MAKKSASVGKRQQRQKQRLARHRRQRLKWIGAGILLLATLLVLLGWNIQQTRYRQAIGEFIPSLGRDHISLGDPHTPYNSDPPTSGPHAAAANNGFYESSIPDENIIHNLERGYVAISYDCDQLEDCQSVRANLRRIINNYSSRQVIAVPRQNRDALVALTAWQRIDLLEEYDEQRITAFIEAWRGRAPKNVP